MSAPCEPWATQADICSPCDDYDFDTVLLDESLEAASQILYDLSGRQFPGECELTVRPHALCACGDFERCGCARRPPRVDLGAYPVVEVSEILEDGAVIPANQYRVDDRRWLSRLVEPGTRINKGWRCCQRTDMPSTEQDTFAVTFTYGEAPPAGGVQAAAALACELALSCQPETVGKCRLPKRVTTITRQGVTLALLDSFTLFDKGLTGLAEVDLWLRAVNPKGLARSAQVWSPDLAPPYVPGN